MSDASLNKQARALRDACDELESLYDCYDYVGCGSATEKQIAAMRAADMKRVADYRLALGEVQQ